MGNSHSLIAAILIISVGFILTIAVIANAQMMGPMTSMFCYAVRAGVATGPQAGICGLFAQNQLAQPQIAPNAVGGTTFPCGSGLTFDSQTGQCVPTGTTTSTTNGVCGVNSILQNGVCVPITTTQTQPTPPTANAGPDQTVAENSTVILNGARSAATTPGATITGYSWTQTAGPAVSLTGANTVTPTFIAPTLTAKTGITFSLTVTDSNGQVSSPNTTQVTVNPG